MARKDFFDDSLLDEDFLKVYRKEPDQGKGKDSGGSAASKTQETLPQERPVDGNGGSGRSVSSGRRGRPRKEKDGKDASAVDGGRLRVYVKPEVRKMMYLYAGNCYMRDGKPVTSSDILERAMRELIRKECPELIDRL